MEDFPFGAANGAMRQMQRQMMQDMDMMMGSMMGGSMMSSPFRSMGGFPSMGPFGGMGGFGLLGGSNMFCPPITDGSGNHPTARRHQLEMNPFAGIGGMLGSMSMGNAPMNGGNVFMSTQVMTIGPDGKQNIEHQTVHKTGDVTETKRRVDRNGTSSVSIGHQIGERAHVIEKKRDKDGIVRKQQKFVNLDEESAEAFDREFTSRVRSNYGYQPRINHSALEYDNGRRAHARSAATSSVGRTRDAPIITLPEEEEEQSTSQSTSNRVGGPVIREIGEEEAQQSIPKRRRGMYGEYHNE